MELREDLQHIKRRELSRPFTLLPPPSPPRHHPYAYLMEAGGSSTAWSVRTNHSALGAPGGMTAKSKYSDVEPRSLSFK